jgi:cation transport regulator
MPYSKIADLPKSVTDNLPTHAQEIFLATFNSAFNEYNGDEQRSFKVAWGAVKNSYEKVDGKWQAIKK